MRLLIMLALAYLGYRAVKSWMIKEVLKATADKPAGRIDDVMVKDPFCEVYFPRRDGIHLRYGNEDLFFCSEECKEKYIANQEGK